MPEEIFEIDSMKPLEVMGLVASDARRTVMRRRELELRHRWAISHPIAGRSHHFSVDMQQLRAVIATASLAARRV